MSDNPMLDVVTAARAVTFTLDGTPLPHDVNRVMRDLVAALEVFDKAEPTYHVIDLHSSGFTIRHPLTCRPNLFACTANEWGRLELSGDEDFGEYRLDPDPDDPQNWIVGDVIATA